MKNLILIALLFVTLQSQAQTAKPIDGFLGVKFGSSAAQVKEALKAKGISFSNAIGNWSLGFDGGTLGGRKISSIVVHFVNDQAYEAVFTFAPEQEAKAIEYYNAVIKDLTDVYGKGKERKKFKAPYNEGDGYEITAIKSGNANYDTSWIDGENYILANIDQDAVLKQLTVNLFYNDGKLRKLYKEQQKTQNKSEF